MSITRYRLISGILVTAGLAAAVYLSVLHVKVYTDPSFHSVCAISSGFNCETVAESPYSIFLGIPISVWGVLGYLAMALALAWSVFQEDLAPMGAMFILALFSSFTSMVLGYISVTRISSVCIFCCFTYIVNFLLLGLTWWTVKGRLREALAALIAAARSHLVFTLSLLVAGGVFLLALVFYYPHYWEKSRVSLHAVNEGGGRHAAQSAGESGRSDVVGRNQRSGNAGNHDVSSGVDKDGHPWFGASDPVVIIHEYSDYQCPFCAHFHAMARALVEKYPKKIRLVHHNFPLDQACNPMIGRPFHPDACRRARLSLCALEKGRFWKGNDWLFSHRKDSFSNESFASGVGLDAAWVKTCMKSEKTSEKLMDDIQKGISMRLEGTPTYVVNGKKYWFQELEKALPGLLSSSGTGNGSSHDIAH